MVRYLALLLCVVMDPDWSTLCTCTFTHSKVSLEPLSLCDALTIDADDGNYFDFTVGDHVEDWGHNGVRFQMASLKLSGTASVPTARLSRIVLCTRTVFRSVSISWAHLACR